jgi:predicted TIM-barrel fold metal-dependent hydrolase
MPAMPCLTCIDCLGPERAMFASDFPVVGLRSTFDEVFDAFVTITVDLSPRDQHALFFGTARPTYGFDELASMTPLCIG